MQAHWPAGAGHLRRVGPSTRGATAPQGAQLVNLVVGRCRYGQLGHGRPSVLLLQFFKNMDYSEYWLPNKALKKNELGKQ